MSRTAYRDLRLSLHNLIYFCITRRVQVRRLGKQAGWHILPNLVGPEAFVVCGGAGNDISFELELMSMVKCKMVLLDPSPTGRKTVVAAKIPPDFVFEQFALTDHTGTAHLAEPREAEEGSWRISKDGKGTQMNATNLSEVMTRHGAERIDLLKIDIEGFEYPVLRDVITRKLPVSQICVEIHQGREFGTTRADRWCLIFQLMRAGFRLVHHECFDHTFVHRTALVSI
jgi:FkbM family methyltransferase